MSLAFWEVVKMWQQDNSIKCRPKGEERLYDYPLKWDVSAQDPNIKWEIEQKKVTITREDLAKAWDITHLTALSVAKYSDNFNHLAKELGL